MTELQFEEVILERLRERNPRFHGKAYLFLLSALHRVIDEMTVPRHISGRELAQGVRDLALERFGPMARTVLEHWGIHAPEDADTWRPGEPLDCPLTPRVDSGSWPAGR